tara:strand:- start:362 stop:622 length:261 start_codon:yes stop_codon:yes gene_type:complete
MKKQISPAKATIDIESIVGAAESANEVPDTTDASRARHSRIQAALMNRGKKEKKDNDNDKDNPVKFTLRSGNSPSFKELGSFSIKK